MLYTYQTCGKEIIKETKFQERLAILQSDEDQTEAQRNDKYIKTLAEYKTLSNTIAQDVREIIFDYFNIIYKEYEVSYEKHKSD